MHLLAVMCIDFARFGLIAVTSVRTLVVDDGYDRCAPSLAIGRVSIACRLQVPALSAPSPLTVDDGFPSGISHIVGRGRALTFNAGHRRAAGDGFTAAIIPSEGGSEYLAGAVGAKRQRGSEGQDR